MTITNTKKKICLDDGHGDFGVTAGKQTPVFPAGHKYAGKFMYENNFNKEVVKIAGEHLVRCGFDVIYSAPTDADTPLQTRTDFANAQKADIFISVHANASTGTWGNARGIETFIYTKCADGSQADKLAKAVHKRLLEGTPFYDRGVHKENFHVLRETACPAILVECGFMDNLREAELLMDGAYRAECGLEIAKGVCDYYGVPFIEEKPVVVPAPVPKVEPVATKDWKDIGFEHLVTAYGIDAKQWTKDSPVTLGLLGEILRRRDTK